MRAVTEDRTKMGVAGMLDADMSAIKLSFSLK
jgi:hypothetical protein